MNGNRKTIEANILLSLYPILIISTLILFLTPSRSQAEPTLPEILQACRYLEPGDIPSDNFLPPSRILYVAPAEKGGNDEHDGLSIETPFEHLEQAIDYANNHADIPITIYLREGIYSFKDPRNHPDNPYLTINRGNLYLAAYPNEQATIRPFYWPGNPSESGDERVFEITGSYENITFDRLHFEGWSILFVLSSPLESDPLRHITIKNITASSFTHRNGEADFLSEFLETGYVDDDVYGEGKVIFDHPEKAKYQVENLILANISVSGVDIAVNIGDENDANVRGIRISHFEILNPPQSSGNSASDAFAIVNSYKILIDHCKIVNIGDDGIDTKSYDVAVVNTYVEGTGRNAAKFWRNGELINSILYNCTQIDDGALIIKDGPFRMIHSVLLEHPVGYAGTYAYDSEQPLNTSLEIVNSVIGRVKSFYVNTTQFQAIHNRFCDMIDEANLLNGTVTARTSEELNAFSNCRGNAISPLQFNNPTLGDFTLLPDSSWIDAGSSEGVMLPTFDFLGNTRIAGQEVDIGPIEFGSTPEVSLSAWFWMN